MGGDTFENTVKKVMPNETKIGGNQMISYYELLGMIKKGEIPYKVEYNYEIYTWEDRCYAIGYKFLSDQLLEIEMFEKNIKIIEVLNEKEKVQNNQK